MNLEERVREIVREEMDKKCPSASEVIDVKPIEEAKKKASKKKSVKKEVKEEPVPETPKQEELDLGDEPVSKQDVLNLLHKVNKEKGMKIAKKILKKFNAQKLSEVSEDDYDAISIALRNEL